MRRAIATCLLALTCLPARAESPGAVDLAVVPPEWRVFGPAAETYIGEAVLGSRTSAGDVNGDGVDDLVMGSERYDGPDGTRTDAGAVFIVFGPLVGQTIDLSQRPPDITILGRIGEQLGRTAPAIGDVSGDGINDLAVTAQKYKETPGDFPLGLTCVLFGPLSARTWDRDIDTLDACFNGVDINDEFGRSVAIGDVTGDGIGDLVVGSELGGGPPGTLLYSGSVSVLAGPLSPGPLRDLRTSPPDLHAHGIPDEVIGGQIMLADVSGDGILDILSGGADSRAGIAVAIFGGPIATPVRDLGVDPPDVMLLGADPGDRMGQGLIAGVDLNGDGFDDLVTCASEAAGPGNTDPGRGELHVLLGPLATGTVIDHVTRTSDFIAMTSTQQPPVVTAAYRNPLGRDALLIDGGTSVELTDCNGPTHAYWLDSTDGWPAGYVDLAVHRPYLQIRSSIPGQLATEGGAFGDLDGDGVIEAIVGNRVATNTQGDLRAGMVMGVERPMDRCWTPPPPMDSTSLRVTRDGQDVVLAFDDSGLGENGIGVDIYRGLISGLPGWPGYDAIGPFAGGCGQMSSPTRDVGVVGSSEVNVYYLAARACTQSCWPSRREITDLGSPTNDPMPMTLLGLHDGGCL